jgi:hypothetical protein
MPLPSKPSNPPADDIEQCSDQAAAYAQTDCQRFCRYGGAGGSVADGAPATR